MNEKKQSETKSTKGHGISQDDIKKVNTKLFYRGKSAKRNNPHGMGVGLSVAKMIAKAHHGSISIQSEGQGLGTTITIEIKRDYLQEVIDN